MEPIRRKPTERELKLLELLIVGSKMTFPEKWKQSLKVSPMDDGGMGSLYLFVDEENNENRKFVARVSEHQFVDKDGVDVIASLNVDEEGQLFELDVWKADFSELNELPDR
ncbi:DUF6984 family protein [Olivibacter domesticus]|nr:hypothetical protein [Olivibacter domesticus]